MTTRSPLPDPFDKRVTTVLAEPLAADVVVAVADIARGKSPALNYRWELHEDGRVFVVRHSGKGGDWQIPFDQPLPAKPALRLPAARVTEVRGWFDDAFMQHPGYEAVRGHDGTWVIVRVRGKAGVHSVVYENVQDPLLDKLAVLVPRPE